MEIGLVNCFSSFNDDCIKKVSLDDSSCCCCNLDRHLAFSFGSASLVPASFFFQADSFSKTQRIKHQHLLLVKSFDTYWNDMSRHHRQGENSWLPICKIIIQQTYTTCIHPPCMIPIPSSISDQDWPIGAHTKKSPPQ